MWRSGESKTEEVTFDPDLDPRDPGPVSGRVVLDSPCITQVLNHEQTPQESYAVQAVFNLVILLPQPPERQDYRQIDTILRFLMFVDP